MGHRWAAVLLLTEIAGQVEPGTGDLRLIPGLLGVGVQALEDGGRLIGRLAGGEVHDHSPAGQGDWLVAYPSHTARNHVLRPPAPKASSAAAVTCEDGKRRRSRVLRGCPWLSTRNRSGPL